VGSKASSVDSKAKKRRSRRAKLTDVDGQKEAVKKTPAKTSRGKGGSGESSTNRKLSFASVVGTPDASAVANNKTVDSSGDRDATASTSSRKSRGAKKSTPDPAQRDRKFVQHYEVTFRVTTGQNPLPTVIELFARGLSRLQALYPSICVYPRSDFSSKKKLVARKDFPTLHSVLVQYAKFDGGPFTFYDNVGEHGRRIVATVTLGGDEDPRIAVECAQVDNHNDKIEFVCKQCQHANTTMNRMLCCVFNRHCPKALAAIVRSDFQKIEKDAIAAGDASEHWKDLPYPDIAFRKMYPKNSYDSESFQNMRNRNQQGRARQDNSHKMGLFLEFPTVDSERVLFALYRWIKGGRMKELLGPLAYVLEQLDNDASPSMMERYKTFLQYHGSVNKGAKAVQVIDVVNMDKEVKISYRPRYPTKQTTTTLRREFNEIGYHEYRLFNSILPSASGCLEAAINKAKDAEDMAADILVHPAGYFLHRSQRKGWDASTIRAFMQSSFELNAIESAEKETKWCKKSQKLITDRMAEDDKALKLMQGAKWLIIGGPSDSAGPTNEGHTRPSAAAFNYDDAVSVTTMRSRATKADDESQESSAAQTYDDATSFGRSVGDESSLASGDDNSGSEGESSGATEDPEDAVGNQSTGGGDEEVDDDEDDPDYEDYDVDEEQLSWDGSDGQAYLSEMLSPQDDRPVGRSEFIQLYAETIMDISAVQDNLRNMEIDDDDDEGYRSDPFGDDACAVYSATNTDEVVSPAVQHVANTPDLGCSPTLDSVIPPEPQGQPAAANVANADGAIESGQADHDT